MTLTILELLYIVLIVFGTIIGLLLTWILVRVLKILGPLVEIANFYNKIKGVFDSYNQIPDIIKEKIGNIVKNKKQEEGEE